MSFCFFNFFCETCKTKIQSIAWKIHNGSFSYISLNCSVLLMLFSWVIQRCPKKSSLQLCQKCIHVLQKSTTNGNMSTPKCEYLFLLGHLLLWFWNNLLLLSEDHLKVAGRTHVRVDTAMGAVCASPHLRGLVYLDVLDDQRVHIQTLQTSFKT